MVLHALTVAEVGWQQSSGKVFRNKAVLIPYIEFQLANL